MFPNFTYIIWEFELNDLMSRLNLAHSPLKGLSGPGRMLNWVSPPHTSLTKVAASLRLGRLRLEGKYDCCRQGKIVVPRDSKWYSMGAHAYINVISFLAIENLFAAKATRTCFCHPVLAFVFSQQLSPICFVLDFLLPFTHYVVHTRKYILSMLIRLFILCENEN